MPLLPNASIKTKYDFTRSRFEWKRQFEVSPTTNIVEEGGMLTRLPGPAGNEVVQQSLTGVMGTGEALAGAALISRITADTFTDVRDYTVPANPGPWTIQLPHANLLITAPALAEAYVWDNTAAAALTVIAHIAVPAPAATQVDIDPVTGLMTFNTAEAEHDVTVTYRWNLTAVERDLILRQSHVNRGAEDQFGLMTVGYGDCLIFSSMYEASSPYLVGDSLYLLGNGCVTATNPGGGELNFGRVVSPPEPGDPYLGFEYNSAVVGP
jgi:hypothetical protein